MYLVTTNRYSRRNPPKTHAIEIHALALPSGQKVTELRSDELYKECRRLKVPEVGAHMGHQELSVRYATFIAESEEAPK